LVLNIILTTRTANNFNLPILKNRYTIKRHHYHHAKNMPIKKFKGKAENNRVNPPREDKVESRESADDSAAKESPAKLAIGIENALDAIRAKFGDEAIMKLGEKPKVNVNAVPTGSLGLDWALGIGGLPQGRIVEIFGPESSGKTTLALHVVAEAQKRGGICAYIDAEHAMDPDYAKRLGVKVDDLLISQPDTGEQALEITDSLVRTGKMDVIVIDSVAALTPKAEIEGDMGAVHIGIQARLMSQALRKLTAIVAKSKTIIIFINQIRMQIGVMFGNPETTPGGKALKFYASVRLDIRRIAQIKKGEEVMGGRVRVKVVKNKVAAPFKQTEFDLMYNEGISREGEIIALGEKFGIIAKSGASYAYGEEKLGRGYDATRQFLKENQRICGEILVKIRAELNKQ
jgi:recombination protein RecA